MKKLHFSKKAVSTCRTWLKSWNKDCFRSRKRQAEMVVEMGFALPACLVIALLTSPKEMSREAFFNLQRMYEVETRSIYPFSGNEVIRDLCLAPSPALGKKIKQKKFLFLAGILGD